jgi:hypothetical protein
VKQAWQGRMLELSQRYGEQAPMATVCCNACRTCVTTNVLALVSGAALGALYATGRLAKRLVGRPSVS